MTGCKSGCSAMCDPPDPCFDSAQSRDGSPAFLPLALGSVPRSLYLHVPFCRHHCGYCNFSVAAGRDYLVPRYLAALARELAALPRRLFLETLYLGGGTPSRLDSRQLGALREALAQRIDLAPNAEVTLEANPLDVTPAWVASAVGFGATRISLGAQSFRQEKLRLLERDHDAAGIARAVELLKQAGLVVSLDLIFAVSGETPAEWAADLGSACVLPIDHLSTYELTYEKGTRFWNRRQAGRLSEQDEDQRSEFYALTLEQLAVAGWEHYEISSFARGGARCQHNQVYWRGLPYHAVGAGASRFLAGVRSTNHHSTIRFIQLVEAGADPTSERQQLPHDALARELLAVGLRQIGGLSAAEFERVSGRSFAATAGAEIAELIDWGLVQLASESKSARLCLTSRGIFLYDAVAAKIAAT
jgi:oxygen-independent coproporphyrinogen-3 oxidase